MLSQFTLYVLSSSVSILDWLLELKKQIIPPWFSTISHNTEYLKATMVILYLCDPPRFQTLTRLLCFLEYTFFFFIIVIWMSIFRCVEINDFRLSDIVSWLCALPGRLKKTKVDRVLMCWWVFTGLTHMIIGGYYVFSPEFFKDKSGFYMAEVCELLWHWTQMYHS